PGGAAKGRAVRPERLRLFIRVANDHIAQHTEPFARRKIAAVGRGLLAVDRVQAVLQLQPHRWQDRGHAFAGAPADRVLAGGERLEDWRVRLLQRLRHHADRLDGVVGAEAGAPIARGIEIPGRAGRRDLAVLPLELDHVLSPRLLDDAEVLLERLAVRLVDRVVLTRRGAVDAVHL